MTSFDLSKKNAGIKILDNYAGKPDKLGVLGQYHLLLPAFTRGVYYQGYWWPSGGNRVYPHVIKPNDNGTVDVLEVDEKEKNKGAEGGIFAILEKKNGEYLAILPFAGTKVYSWFSMAGGELVKTDERTMEGWNQTGFFDHKNGKLTIKFGHHGLESVAGNVPLCAWATGKTPYAAANKVWQMAADADFSQGRVKMREDKTYPEIFKYLGWCSWDAFHLDIDEEKLVKTIKEIISSDIPIRWILIDDGHYDKKTLFNHPEKFPNSYQNLIALRNNNEKIKWMGIWYAMFGNFEGTEPNPGWDDVKDHLSVVNNKILPKNDIESAKKYYSHMFRETVKYKFDFLKTDFQTHNIGFFSGNDWNFNGGPKSDVFKNPYSASVNAQEGFHKVVQKNFGDTLMNCNWQNPAALFNSFDSVVGRCSEDNRGGTGDATSHTWHAFAAIPWQGQISWGDHDMFHSGDKDPKAAEINAISKALSGGPVFVGELPEKIRGELLTPMCYEDGLLLRPLAPGAPFTEDLFARLYYDKMLTAAVAPLANKTATIFIYNTFYDLKEQISRTLTADDYAQAAEMIQPYSGTWPVPEEGLIVYDWQNQKVQKLGKGYQISLSGLDCRLIQVSPITNSWSVIGRPDKYLSASAIESVDAKPEQLTVKLVRSGPLAIWSGKGTPKAEGIDFVNKGNGLYIAEIPVSREPKILKITR